MKIKHFFKAASAATALSLALGMFPVLAENTDKVYSYDFENDLRMQISDGGASGEIVNGYGDNTTKVLKVTKTSTESTAAKNRVQLYPLGEKIDISGGNKYFFVKFKIYTDGEGFDSLAVSNSSAAAICDPITVNENGGLSANSWNDVEVHFKISEQRVQIPFTYYTAVSDVFINGEKTVSGGVKENISQMSSLNGCFDIRILLKSNKSSVFTVYMDDLSLETNEVPEPILIDTAKYTVQDKNVITEENTAVGELLCAAGCTVSAYRNGEPLGENDILLSGDTVSVENVVGVKNIYTVKIKGEDLKPKVICSFDFEDGTALGADREFTADGCEVTVAENVNESRYAAKIEKNFDSALLFKLGENISLFGADNTTKYFILKFREYSENTVKTASFGDFSGNLAESGAEKSLNAGEWNDVVYMFYWDVTLKYEAYVNKTKAGEGSISGFSQENGTGNIAFVTDFGGELYIDDVILSSYGKNPICVPSLKESSFYSVSGNRIELTAAVSADMLECENAQGITVYSDSLKNSELSHEELLRAGNIIALSGEYADAQYKIVKDSDTLYFRDFEDNLSVTFTNATSAVEAEFVSAIGGKSTEDKCLKIHANEKGGGNDPCCKAALMGKADIGKEYYKVEFNILPNNEKFTSVSLAGGWTNRMTPYVSVGDSGLVRDKWNRVTFILKTGNMRLDGSRYRFDVTSDTYVNGKIYAQGEKITTYPLDPSKNEAVFPIFLRLNSSDSENEYITYVDDIIASSPANEPTFTLSAKQIGTKDGRAIVLPATQLKLSSNYPIKSYSDIMLNSEKIPEDKLEKGESFIKVNLENLNCGEVYSLSGGETESVDCFGRSISLQPFAFETAARVTADSFSFDKSKLTQGKVTARAAGLTSITGNDENTALIMALTKDNKIIKTEIKNFTVKADSVLAAECTVDVPDVSDGEYELRCFIWSGIKDRISYKGFIRLAE